MKPSIALRHVAGLAEGQLRERGHGVAVCTVVGGLLHVVAADGTLHLRAEVEYGGELLVVESIDEDGAPLARFSEVLRRLSKEALTEAFAPFLADVISTAAAAPSFPVGAGLDDDDEVSS